MFLRVILPNKIKFESSVQKGQIPEKYIVCSSVHALLQK